MVDIEIIISHMSLFMSTNSNILVCYLYTLYLGSIKEKYFV